MARKAASSLHSSSCKSYLRNVSDVSVVLYSVSCVSSLNAVNYPLSQVTRSSPLVLYAAALNLCLMLSE